MLKEELMKKLKQYMIEKNDVKKNAIQGIRAQILKYEKDNKIEADDNKILDIIAHEIKSVKDSIPDFEKGNRQDLIEKANIEIETISEFMPKQLEKDEVKNIIKTLKEENNIEDMKQMGQLIKLAKEKIGQASDGKTIADIVKEVLNNN